LLFVINPTIKKRRGGPRLSHERQMLEVDVTRQSIEEVIILCLIIMMIAVICAFFIDVRRTDVKVREIDRRRLDVYEFREFEKEDGRWVEVYRSGQIWT
jgi:hypothetical protein